MIHTSPSAGSDGSDARIYIDDGRALDRSGVAVETVPAADQFALQADAFAECAVGGATPEWPLEDAVANARVIEAVFESAKEGRAVTLSRK